MLTKKDLEERIRTSEDKVLKLRVDYEISTKEISELEELKQQSNE